MSTSFESYRALEEYGGNHQLVVLIAEEKAYAFYREFIEDQKKRYSYIQGLISGYRDAGIKKVIEITHADEAKCRAVCIVGSSIRSYKSIQRLMLTSPIQN